MTEMLKAKLLELRAREIVQNINHELERAGTPKKAIDLEYNKEEQNLSYYIEGDRAKISCIMNNVSAELASRVKKAFTYE